MHPTSVTSQDMGSNGRAGLNVPETAGSVPATGCENLAVWRKLNRFNPPRVPREGRGVLLLRDRPELDDLAVAIGADEGQEPFIRRDRLLGPAPVLGGRNRGSNPANNLVGFPVPENAGPRLPGRCWPGDSDRWNSARGG